MGIFNRRAVGRSFIRQRPNDRGAAAALALGLVCAAFVGASVQSVDPAKAALAPAGQGFTLNEGDMRFILKQIKIAEHHATTESGPGAPLVGTGEFQITNPNLPYGLRTVDGSENNLLPGQQNFGANHQKFPRLTTPSFKPAEDSNVPGVGPVGPPGQTSYAQKTGNVVDSQPRLISNLIVDQTSTNPAAIKAAKQPHRTFLGEPVEICTAPDTPAGCTPEHSTLFMPNVTTDVGLSPPFNSWFTLFGQFFDHGVDFTAKSGGAVFVPLKADDPLIAGPDHVFGNGDDLPANRRFMVLTRATNQPGPDGIMGTGDDEQNAINDDTPWVDQSQTYTSHPAHQVFLREYELNAANRTVSNGKMLRGPDGGMARWSTVKDQAEALLGITLKDSDALDIPLIATDQYGRYLRGPARGLPQIVTATGLVEGNRTSPIAIPANAKRLKHGFLLDIAHNAVPTPGLNPDGDSTVQPSTSTPASGTYDNESLDRHFIAGDGRVNENIGLTAVHQVFHSEHNRLVDYMQDLITTKNIDVAEWHNTDGSWNGERLFQAARFVTEMEYQHLVFEEFARKVSPGIDPFNPTTQAQTNVNPAIKAEFAHAVYRFGHSMLTDTVARTNADGSGNDIDLIGAFLNPVAYNDGGPLGTLTPEDAAGSIVQGMTDQTGNEIDEFVTEALRNNLLGLPLDLPAINMTRAREAGVPSLNNFRKQVYATTHDGALKPYTDWVDFGLSLKHQYSVVNFMAAYGTHPTIVNATTIVGKRTAAQRIYDNDPLDPLTPADAANFANSAGTWANNPDGSSKTGLDTVDLWVGGLAESQNLFGGLLGSTFNYVFEQQLTDLQNGDRFYYLTRTPGLNLRAQLEGNSFAELIQRNTTARGLKADVFSTADCEFDLTHLVGSTFGTIPDDLTSECDESKVLIRMADGTIRYRQTNEVDPQGLNAQSIYSGTSGADRVHGGVDNDTFWGNEGNDRIEGDDGSDAALGGEGNDLITDKAGDDSLKGGPGNDRIDAGPGLDLLQPGTGDDFTDGGMNNNQTFGGEGDDLMILGNGADSGFGGGGDDWLEGGNGGDTLIGDSGSNFFDDVDTPGNDVLIGDGGEGNADAEGGDDIIFNTAEHDRNSGVRGYDWVTHARSTVKGESDLRLAIANLPDPQVTVRDRFTEVEGLSGWKFDDVLRGDAGSEILTDLTRNDMNATSIARINGLSTVVGSTTFFAGTRNILLGGGGSDIMEGREGDDIIDGDRWLDARLRVPDVSTPVTTDTKLVTSLTEVRDDIMAGRIDPGAADIVRSIVTEPAGSEVDAAVFSGPRADYDVIPNINRNQMTVIHARGAATDGTDIVRNVERLTFADQSVTIGPFAIVSPPNLNFTVRPLNTTSPGQQVIVSNTGTANLAIASIQRVGSNPGEFLHTTTCGANLAPGNTCVVNVTFRPTVAGPRTAILRITDNQLGIPGSIQDVVLSGAGQAPNQVATGVPVLSDTTPTRGQTLSVDVSGIADGNGVGPFNYQWQRTNQAGNVGTFANIAGPAGTGASFTVPNVADSVGRRYRVIVSFTDQYGYSESTTSAASSQTTNPINSPATGVPTLSDTTPQRGQILTANTGGIADGNGLGAFSFRWQRTNQAGNVNNFNNVVGAAGAGSSFTVPNVADSVGRRYRVVVMFTDAAGFNEIVASAASAQTTNGPNLTALAARSLTVTSEANEPLTLEAMIPAGARAARISVFELQGSPTARNLTARSRHVMTAYRTITAGKRYTFRMTESKLRKLKPGRYMVRVQVGASRSKLGPASSLPFTVR